jgi:predicted nucleic acid-binding protein
VLLAGADKSDPDHESCRELLETDPGPLITTELVLAETGWLIDRQLGPAAEAAGIDLQSTAAAMATSGLITRDSYADTSIR